MKPFMDNYGLTEDYLRSLNFHQFERYSDMTFAEIYEGIPQRVNWTDEQLAMIQMQLKAVLVNTLTDFSRKL